MSMLRKRMITLALAFVMIFSCIPELPARAETYRDIYDGEVLVVSAAGVNLHLVPSVDSHIITTMPKGSTFCVLSVNTATHWIRVVGQNGGKTYTGYMLAEDDSWYSQHEDLPTVYPYNNMKAVVMANVLNVHSTPAANKNTIIGTLGYGNEVNALGYTATGWTKIQFKNQEAYVSTEWVTIKRRDADVAPAENFENVYGYSAQVKSGVGALNIHCSPSQDSEVIAELYEGRVVTILARSANWYKVTLNVDDVMETGYILRSYCKQVDALKNLSLDRTSKTLKVGKKYHILVRGTTGMNVTLKFKTSNKKVAAVSKTGYVTAKKKGNAKITCTVKVGGRSKKLTFKVKVKK